METLVRRVVCALKRSSLSQLRCHRGTEPPREDYPACLQRVEGETRGRPESGLCGRGATAAWLPGHGFRAVTLPGPMARKNPEKTAGAAVKTVATNRKAFHDFFIEDRAEAGLVLTGTEVKSLRDGRAQLKDSYFSFRR